MVVFFCKYLYTYWLLTVNKTYYFSNVLTTAICFSLIKKKDGKLVNVIIGTDASRLIQLIVEELDQYVKFKNGEIHKEFVSIQ